MPDISMCQNTQCADRLTCYRFNATPTPGRQAYADFAPDENGECAHYWEAPPRVTSRATSHSGSRLPILDPSVLGPWPPR